MRMLQVVITGKRGDVATEALVDAAHSVFAPDKVSVLKAYLEAVSFELLRACEPDAAPLFHPISSAVHRAAYRIRAPALAGSRDGPAGRTWLSCTRTQFQPEAPQPCRPKGPPVERAQRRRLI